MQHNEAKKETRKEEDRSSCCRQEVKEFLSKMHKKYPEESLAVMIQEMEEEYKEKYDAQMMSICSKISAKNSDLPETKQEFQATVPPNTYAFQYLQSQINPDEQYKKDIPIRYIELKIQNKEALEQKKTTEDIQDDQQTKQNAAEKIDYKQVYHRKSIQMVLDIAFEQHNWISTKMEKTSSMFQSQMKMAHKLAKYINRFSHAQKVKNISINNCYHNLNDNYTLIQQYYDQNQSINLESTNVHLKHKMLLFLSSLFNSPRVNYVNKYYVFQMFIYWYYQSIKAVNKQLSILPKKTISFQDLDVEEEINSIEQFRIRLTYLQHTDAAHITLNLNKIPDKVISTNDWELYFNKIGSRLSSLKIMHNYNKLNIFVIQCINKETREKTIKFVQKDINTKSIEGYFNKQDKKVYNVILNIDNMISNIGEIKLEHLSYRNFQLDKLHIIEFKHAEILVSASLHKVNVTNLGSCKNLANLYMEECKINQNEFQQLTKLKRLHSIDNEYELSDNQKNSCMLHDIFKNKELIKVIQVIIIEYGENTLKSYTIDSEVPQLRCLDLWFNDNSLENQITVDHDKCKNLSYLNILNGQVCNLHVDNTIQCQCPLQQLNKFSQQYLTQMSRGAQFEAIEQLYQRYNDQDINIENQSIKRYLITHLLSLIKEDQTSGDQQTWENQNNKTSSPRSSNNTNQQNIQYQGGQCNIDKKVIKNKLKDTMLKDLLINIASESSQYIEKLFKNSTDNVDSAIKTIIDSFESEDNNYKGREPADEHFKNFVAPVTLSMFRSFSRIKVTIPDDEKDKDKVFQKTFGEVNLYKNLEKRVQIIKFTSTSLIIKWKTEKSEDYTFISGKEIDSLSEKIKNQKEKMKNLKYCDVIAFINDSELGKSSIPLFNEEIRKLPIRYLNYYMNKYETTLKLDYPEKLINATLQGVDIENLSDCENLKNLAIQSSTIEKHRNQSSNEQGEEYDLEKLKNLERLHVELDAQNSPNAFIKKILQQKKLIGLYISGSYGYKEALDLKGAIPESLNYLVSSCWTRQSGNIVKDPYVKGVDCSIYKLMEAKDVELSSLDRLKRLVCSFYLSGFIDQKYLSVKREGKEKVFNNEMYLINLQLLLRYFTEDKETKAQIKDYLLSTIDSGAERLEEFLVDGTTIAFPRLFPGDNQLQMTKEVASAFVSFRKHVTNTNCILRFGKNFKFDDLTDEYWIQAVNGDVNKTLTMFYAENEVEKKKENKTDIENDNEKPIFFPTEFAVVVAEISDKDRQVYKTQTVTDEFFQEISKKHDENVTFQAIIMTMDKNVQAFAKLPLTRLSYFLDLKGEALKLKHPKLLQSAFLRNVTLEDVKSLENVQILSTNYCRYPEINVEDLKNLLPKVKSFSSVKDVNMSIELLKELEARKSQNQEVKFIKFQPLDKEETFVDGSFEESSDGSIVQKEKLQPIMTELV